MVDANLTQKIEVFLQGRNLPRLDLKSETDPFCIVYMRNNRNTKWLEYGRTEVVRDSANPDFVKQFVIDYHFEELQEVRVDMFDEDKYTKPDYVGSCEFTVGQLMGSRGQTLKLDLSNPKRKRQQSLLIARAEVVAVNSDILNLTVFGKGLDNKDGWFGKSDPFLQIERSREGNEWVAVYKTEVVRDNLNPKWQPLSLSMQKLCNGDVHRPIRFIVYDWEKSGKHQFIGQFTTTVDRILAYKENKPYEVINEARRMKKGKKYVNSGTIQMENVQLEKGYTLLEYIRGGMQISMITVVDFTGSNGDPRYPQSLHYLSPNPGQLNFYEAALQSVGQIVIDYDTDKLVPCYGFGALTPGTNVANHCFPLSFNMSNPAVYGVNGMLQIYRHALRSVVLSGPTLFSGILQEAIRQCSAHEITQQNQNYSILMILTDGIINDLDETIAMIVHASHLPMSIIIVGVGSADFSTMEALDSDERLLRDRNGNVACRDIVQFVPFSKFGGDGTLLAKEVLAEIPKQIVGTLNDLDCNQFYVI
uniref:C2 domain-containing protein n=2 Tax=Aplanochytrium stocchinoi TaxID=215587 RepID=A0A7S3PIB1_9STRA|mmetsp:Transcript_35688/g.44268  ORF Transcript_35688/g.44268 Transcript_35688/m.44268 type:complete len:532 (-) Transcript_35688:304-1899(-)